MGFRFSANSLKHREGVDSKLIEVDDLAIQLTKIDYGHPKTGGLRSDKEQYQLYLDKASPCDGIKNRSAHQDGMALDFFAYVNGKVSYKKEHLAQIACAYYQAASILGDGYQIGWGGLFKKSFDGPHIERVIFNE